MLERAVASSGRVDFIDLSPLIFGMRFSLRRRYHIRGRDLTVNAPVHGQRRTPWSGEAAPPHTRGASGRRSPPRTTYLAGYSATRTSTSSSDAPVHELQIALTFLASDSTAPSLRPSRMWQKIRVSEVGSPEREGS